jgi:hypothetical protein
MPQGVNQATRPDVISAKPVSREFAREWQFIQIVAASLLPRMYGPLPSCKRFEFGRGDSLRECIRREEPSPATT